MGTAVLATICPCSPLDWVWLYAGIAVVYVVIPAAVAVIVFRHERLRAAVVPAAAAGVAGLLAAVAWGVPLAAVIAVALGVGALVMIYRRRTAIQPTITGELWSGTGPPGAATHAAVRRRLEARERADRQAKPGLPDSD